ncbi:MAG: hypothetical protein V1826_03110 [bacterium]
MYGLPPLLSFYLLLGMIITMIGFCIGMYCKSRDGEPHPVGVLILIVGLAVCCVITIIAPHNKTTCVACYADPQQQSRPGYDWMEQQRQLQEH